MGLGDPPPTPPPIQQHVDPATVFGNSQWAHSSLTRGIANEHPDRARRRVLCTDSRWLDGSGNSVPDAVEKAIAAAVEHYGVFYSTVDSLPLNRIRGERWGPTKVYLDLIYLRDRTTLPIRDPALMAPTRGTYRTVSVYRSVSEYGTLPVDNNLPSGPIRGTPDIKDKGIVPTPYELHLPVISLNIETVLPYNPLFANFLFAGIGTLNSLHLTLGGILYPAGTLRLDDIDSEPFSPWPHNRTSTPSFAVAYQMTASPIGWFKQEVFFDDSAAEWVTDEFEEYRRTGWIPFIQPPGGGFEG